MFFTILLAMLSIFLMIAVGFWARARGWVDAGMASGLSRITLKLFYPALIFSALTQRFDRASLLRSWPLPASAFLMAAVGFGFGWLLSRGGLFDRAGQRNTFRFQCTMNNYSFLPMPLLIMLRGEEAVAFLIFSALGSEIACWTLGIMALTGGSFNRQALRRLLNVPMITVALALLTIWFRETAAAGVIAAAGDGWAGDIAGSIVSAADMFGGATIPLAMLVAGCGMADLHINHIATKQQALLLVSRLLLIPSLTVGILFLLPLAPEMREVLLVVAVMPCAVTSVVLAQAYGSDSAFAASSVFTTQVASLLTVPLWLSLTL